MDTLVNIVQTITGMGASAILPIIITILGLVFRMKLGDAIKAGLTVGVGYFIFDNFFIGLAVTVILSVLALFVGDWVAPMWQEYYGLEGTTCTTIIHTGWTLIVAWAMNKLIDFIPGLNKLDISLERLLGCF